MVAAAAEAGPGVVWELLSPPSDAVTNIRFSSHSDHLLVSSLDLKLRLYDAAANVLKGEFLNQGPVLDCCFHDDSSGYSGTASADNRVSRFDFSTGSELFLGSHEAHVCCVEYSHPTGQVFTGSRDKTVRCWDARSATHLGAYAQPDMIVSMSLVDQHLVVATGDRHIIVYDIRQMSHPKHISETLRCQTCCVRCYPSGTGYAVSSMDGRVIMDYFDASEAKTRKYAFKCHRNPETQEKWEQIFYPVNALAFHPVYGTLATGGADRHVNIWDGNSKKRLFQYSKSPYPISALTFSRDGQMLAVASSYTFDPEEEPSWIESVNIHVRRVNEAEVKPKRSSRH